MNIFFCFKSDFSHLSLLKYLPASIKSFTSIHFTFYISYWQDFTHIHIICSIYIFEPSLPRQHHGNHTVGYCASYFVFFMNKYVNITRAQAHPLSAETPLNKTSPQSIISLQWSELQAGDASSSSAILKYEVGANVVTKGFSRALATHHFNGKCMEGEVWSSPRGRCVKISRRSEPSKPEGRHHTKT